MRGRRTRRHETSRTLRRGVIAVMALLPAAALPLPGSPPRHAGASPLRLDAFVERYSGARVHEVSYPTYDARGRRIAPTRYRVVSGTGNRRENYLAATRDGMLLDFGGEWLRFSRDDGRTWSEVLPAPEMRRGWISYEGAVAVAPGGDVVAAGQDYPTAGGLRAMTFKYEAAARKWFYSFAETQAPGVDRPTVAVVPGPFAVAGVTVPYISLLRGGLFEKPPFLYSLDGLNYLAHSSRFADQATNLPRSEPLAVERWAELDWIQPHELIGVAPYGRGKAIAETAWWGYRSLDDHAPRTIFDPQTLRWARYDFPSPSAPEQQNEEPAPFVFPGGRTLADSRGVLHHVSLKERAIDYLMSRDGGRTWSRTSVPLLKGFRVGMDIPEIQKSFRVSGEHQTALVAVHVAKRQEPLVTRDLVYRFSVAGTRPVVTWIHELGYGEFGCLPGGLVSSGGIPCDFPSIAMLPGGRFAASFTDEDHATPSIAIELPAKR